MGIRVERKSSYLSLGNEVCGNVRFSGYSLYLYSVCFSSLEENVAPDDVKDKREVEMEDPVCITLEYYR